jgi:hypothetical protein
LTRADLPTFGMPSIINNRVGSLANLSLRSSLAMSNIWSDIPIEPQSIMGPRKLTAVAIWPWFFTNAIATYPQLFKALPFSQLSAGGHSQTHGAACKLQSASPISAIQKIMSKLFRFRIWKSSQLARAIREKKKKKGFWFPTTKDIQEEAAVPSLP